MTWQMKAQVYWLSWFQSQLTSLLKVLCTRSCISLTCFFTDDSTCPTENAWNVKKHYKHIKTPVCGLHFLWACPLCLSLGQRSSAVNKQSLARGIRHVSLQVTLMTQLPAFTISCFQFSTNLNISNVTLPVWSTYSCHMFSATLSHLNTQTCIFLSCSGRLLTVNFKVKKYDCFSDYMASGCP